MNKTLMALAAVLCCAAVLCACKKNNPSTGPSKQEDKTPVAAEMNYSFTVGDQLFNYTNLFAEYLDADGKVQTEQLTGKQWTKTVKTKLPANFTATLKATLKSGTDIASVEKFHASIIYGYSGTAVTSSGEQVGKAAIKSKEHNIDMKGEKVEAWLERNVNGLVTYTVSFDANGTLTAGGID